MKWSMFMTCSIHQLDQLQVQQTAMSPMPDQPILVYFDWRSNGIILHNE